MLHARTGKDFWSGIMFLCFAAVGFFVSRGYSMGTAGKMGPGFFPMLLAIVLALLGLILIARAIAAGDEAVPAMSIRPLFFLVASVAIFGLTIRPLGLIVSLTLTLAITALASRETKLVETIILTAALAAVSVGIFHYALQLPLPIVPTLFSTES